MQLKDVEPPVTTNERQELKETKRPWIGPGNKIVLIVTSVLAMLAMMYGVLTGTGVLGSQGQGAPAATAETAKKNAPKSDPPPFSLPVAVAGTDAGGSNDQAGLCNGRKLPPGMPCTDPQNKTGQAGTGPASAASQAGAPAGTSQAGPAPIDEIRARRFAGELDVRPASYAPPSAGTSYAGGEGGTGGRYLLGGGQPAGSAAPPHSAAPLSSFGGGGPAASSGAPTQLGSMLVATETPSVSARYKLNQDYILRKGTNAPCTLIPAVRTSVPGAVSCLLSAPLWSMNGRVVLMEPGTIVNGEYASNNLGSESIFLLWTDADTPRGVSVAFNSPATDALGRAGMPGIVDNKWIERYAGVLLYSTFEDALNIRLAKAAKTEGNNNITQYPGTTDTSKAIVEDMLKQSSGARRELYQNQGAVVNIQVARDIDFSKVYALRSTALEK